MKNHLREQKLASFDIPNLQEIIDESNITLNITSIRFDEEGDTQTSADFASFIGMASTLIIYIFLFMYGGMVMEEALIDDIFHRPRHPYTMGLLASIPNIKQDKSQRLTPIPGSPPNLLHPVPGDAFAPRNSYALNIDERMEPPMFKVSDTHYAATWLLDERAPKVEMPKELRARIQRMMKEAN